MAVRSYVCPGETHPISRPVHLARLAADYAKCPSCPHCDDLGGIGLPPRPPRVDTPLAPVLQQERLWRSLRHPGARSEILSCCEALAAMLWQRAPWDLPVNDWDLAASRRPAGPPICIGWQATGIAESFAMDVIRVLSRSGCRVTSVGAVTRPALDFAVDHLECRAGLWIEGTGSPAGIGFRVVGPASGPWSAEGQLKEIVIARDRGSARPCRIAGVTKSFDVLPAYRESLVRHFGSEAPVVAATGWSEALQSAWSGLAARVACRLVEASIAGRHDGGPSAAVARGLQEAAIRQRLAGGVAFGDDGRQIWFVAPREGLLPDRVLAERLAGELRRESGERGLRVVAAEELMWTELNVPGVRLIASGSGEENLVAAMKKSGAALGCDGAGRFWIARPSARCDGLLTLAFLARAISNEGTAPARAA